ncbi:MAG: tyrosine-type recombinase/integrase, partial [Shewanella sp.]
MEANKIRVFITDLMKSKTTHAFYQEMLNAFLKQSDYKSDLTKENTEKLTKAFYKSYKNLLKHLNIGLIKSETNVLPEELEALIAQLAPAVLGKQQQLLMLKSILNYAKKHYNIDSPNIPVIVELKRDKPILTPVDLLKLPIVELLTTIVDSELTSPKKNLPLDAKLGRCALLIFLTVALTNTKELLLILNSPRDVFYVGGICYWQSKQEKGESTRFILSDVAVMALQQWTSLIKKKEFNVTNVTNVTNVIIAYLKSVSDFDWSDLSILKLRVLRKIDNVIRYGPVQYQMYLLPSTSQILPDHALMRLLTNKACNYFEPYQLEQNALGSNMQKYWRQQIKIKANAKFSSINETMAELQKIFVNLLQAPNNTKSRKDYLKLVNDAVNEKAKTDNPYLWLLCSWLFSLLKTGGTYKKRLKVSTTVDYV